MEECNKRKRAQDDSVSDSPDSKLSRVDSDSDFNSSESRLVRVNSTESREGCELERDQSDAAVHEIEDDLLNMLDEAENVTERDPNVQLPGLDSFIKSFEEEILAPAPDPSLVPESGEFKPNLGYLLEASDDELGLPPTVAQKEETEKTEIENSGRVGPEGVDLTGFLGFDDDIRNYDGFGFVGYDSNDNGGGYVTIDGLFDYAEPADILWRSESLQAM